MRIWNQLVVAAILTGCSLSFTAPQAVAQAPAPAGMKIGVVDVGFLLDHFDAMKKQLEAVDVEIKAEEERIQKQREAVLNDLNRLRTLNEDSTEFKQLESQIAEKEAGLKLEFMRREKEFNEKRAQILHDAYKQVQVAVQKIADHNQVSLVLRYSGNEMDPKKPATVTNGISRDIVYFNASVDLTPLTAQYLGIDLSKVSVAAQPAPTAAR